MTFGNLRHLQKRKFKADELIALPFWTVKIVYL